MISEINEMSCSGGNTYSNDYSLFETHVVCEEVVVNKMVNKKESEVKCPTIISMNSLACLI